MNARVSIEVDGRSAEVVVTRPKEDPLYTSDPFVVALAGALEAIGYDPGYTGKEIIAYANSRSGAKL